MRILRERGLVRLRGSPLPSLITLAQLRYPAMEPVSAVERILARAVEALEGGKLGESAAYLFGLVRGTRDWSAASRRRRAAEIYGVSPDSFRKHQEVMILAQVAECLLSGGGEVAETPSGHVAAPARLRFLLGGAAGEPSVTVQVRPIELITGVDVLVSSENVHMETAKIYGSSVSGAIRRTGAIRGAAGEVVSDVIHDELHDWMTKNGRHGLPVAPGTVAPTGPGALSANGVRRIYHAAVVVPRQGSNFYDVDHTSLVYAVRQVFRLAEEERGAYDPPLSALCFPLLGTGRGGLPLEVGARWLWTGLRECLSVHRHWQVHIAIPNAEMAEIVARVVSDES
ncbi:hypothetical protein J5X84_31555 [Streptosporangiaceae bacterium NEAU-GS5]|nr:hypothetical protein [Streptosporangiaceae bacterium NEAU-GS5]